MKKLKETKLGVFLNTHKIGKVLTSAGLGALKGVPVIGNIASELRDNYKDDLTGTDKVNGTRMAVYIIVSALMLGRLLRPDIFNEALIESILNNL